MVLFNRILERKWILVIALMILLPRETNGYGWTALDWDWPHSTVRVVNDTVNSITVHVIRCCGYLQKLQYPPKHSQKPTSSDVVTFVNGIYHSEEDWQVNIYHYNFPILYSFLKY